MAKNESTYLSMTATLVVVTLVAALSLGFVYEWTKEPIAAARLLKQQKAIDKVLGKYDNNPLEEKYSLHIPGLKDSLEVFPAYLEGKLSGMAVKTYSPNGYSGNVWLMVGFMPEGSIHNITVLEHKETPGLGSKMADPEFIEQFASKHPDEFSLKVKKDGGDVDALTGATITSRAFGEAIQTAHDALKKGGKDE